ncbi:FAD-dependent monooxygenase [Pseudorhodoplanes sp.]|uniref:FAD-dependent monooxygenase n=1 Tax=Pseudorhodoplanes sp. TaxID=1934341 RepID=UPI002D13547D|nr:FAD-dependent monooxygenase [Pseudorhodoplanes sp.]HWV40257.1 FAD-dependent monooxygenase [Pseudorhodoplanes sp.]
MAEPAELAETSTSVLIVGGGPIGLALAADLGRRGVDTLLIERRPDKLASARMLEVGARTMEFCRRLGIAEEVRNWGFPGHYNLDTVFVTGLEGYEIGRVRSGSLNSRFSSEYSPERARPCPQTWFDPILQKCARSFAVNQLRYETELETFVQDADAVLATVRCRKTGRRQKIRAAYLVGCDGSDSTTRELLGIQLRGRKQVDLTVNVYLRIPDFLSLHHTKQALRYVFVGPEGTWSFLTMIDGKDLYRLQILGLDQDSVNKIDVDAMVRRCFGRPVFYILEDKISWVRKMTIADRFMDGRVFLAGDACHAHPPNGGLGMNTGLQDSFDLSWKLAAVLKGWGGQALLDSYECERRPASSRATEVSLLNYGRLMNRSNHPDIEAPTEAGYQARREVGERLVRENLKAWQPPGVHLGYIYDPSPIVVPDGTPRPVDDTHGYRPTTYPGARAPHFWLRTELSTIDLFGGGFVLVRFEDVDTGPLEEAARLRRVPLEIHHIVNEKVAQLYEKPLVLVRPDGHVAWRGDALPANCLELIDTVRGAGSRIIACRGNTHSAPEVTRPTLVSTTGRARHA